MTWQGQDEGDMLIELFTGTDVSSESVKCQVPLVSGTATLPASLLSLKSVTSGPHALNLYAKGSMVEVVDGWELELRMGRFIDGASVTVF